METTFVDKSRVTVREISKNVARDFIETHHYTHRVRAVETKLRSLERRVDWVEKLLWLSAGALISWLVTLVLRSM